MLRVVIGRKVALFLWTIGRKSLSRIVNPTDDVIEVSLLANLLQIRGKGAADFVLLFAD